MTFDRRSKVILFCLCAATLSSPMRAAAMTVVNDLGTSLTVDGDHGNFEIDTKTPAWKVGGNIGAAVTDVVAVDGKDNIGLFREISFNWRAEGRRAASIRLYRTRPVVLFTETFHDAVDHSPAPFPVISKLPEHLLEFRYGEADHLRPESFHLANGSATEQYGGPFALFDTNANALILSPASDFMIAMISGDQQHGLRSGFNKTLQSVPAGYSHQTLLAIDKGINQTWQTWGHAMTDLYAKARRPNDSEIGLKYLGYWTDNGSYYYYNYNIDRGYADTLVDVKTHLAEMGVPIHYMQLDSWWYPKTLDSFETKASGKSKAKDPRIPAGTWNRYGGLLEYTASPDLFPHGLATFHDKLALPLITHSRWIDPQSPYHTNYKISGVVSVDPKWWDKIIADVSSWGVITYEQDWLNWIYLKSPELSSTTWAGDAFMDAMASACAAHGMTIQLCMVMPRYVLQAGAKYPNFTTVRVSGDRLDRGKWKDFLLGSELASALGVWPWTDVYHSNETPNILISTLSAGMVGVSDKIGNENLENIFRAVRKDGVIVKPDVPMTPTDSTFIAEGQNNHSPLICATHTTNKESTAGGIAYYIFTFDEKRPTKEYKTPNTSWNLDPKLIGIVGPAFAYDFFTGTGELIDTGKTISRPLNADGWDYSILSPVGSSGMALIGDIGKFVTRGKKRIPSIQETNATLQASVLMATGEASVTLAIYAPSKPKVDVTNGSCRQLSYDVATKLTLAQIDIDPTAPSVVIDGDRVTPVEVTFRLPQP